MLVSLAVWVLDVLFFSSAGSDLAELGVKGKPLLIMGYALIAAVALAWRKAYPLWVFGVVCLHAVIGAAFVPGYQPVLATLVALFTVGALLPRERAWLILPAIVPFGVIAANEALRTPDRQLVVFGGLIGFYALVNAGVWALGHWTALSRRRLAEAHRLREVEARLAVAAERNRLSRELHDIVAHAVTVMVLQAAGAQKVLRTDPDRASEALEQVAGQGKQAMGELRRMLSLLDTAATDPGAPVQPGLSDLDDLVAGVRAMGVPVQLSVEGRPLPVDPSVGLAAYRAVQEALTNTAKHAGAGVAASVRLVWSDELTIEVDDAGVATPPATSKALSTGHGLLGLRERISIAGGRLTSGARPEGGYRLTVTLPVGS